MRLFVTVGAQMPFDRLIEAVDAWAGAHPEHQVLAQVGDSSLAPRHLEAHPFLEPRAFEEACDAADAIVGHAGIGTLFSAFTRGKPVLVMPRHARLRETRNDHQIATARYFADKAGVAVAWDERELAAALDALLGLEAEISLAPAAGGRLVTAIAAFIDQA